MTSHRATRTRRAGESPRRERAKGSHSRFRARQGPEAAQGVEGDCPVRSHSSPKLSLPRRSSAGRWCLRSRPPRRARGQRGRPCFEGRIQGRVVGLGCRLPPGALPGCFGACLVLGPRRRIVVRSRAHSVVVVVKEFCQRAGIQPRLLRSAATHRWLFVTHEYTEQADI